MKKFQKFSARIAAISQDHIDTDQIIPARFLKTTSKIGLGDQLFYDWRYHESGEPKPEFILNRPEGRAAGILLAGDNFGCGSSREHAPWALTQYGFRAVISTSFADIFRGNALKNSLLPIVVPPDAHKALFEAYHADPSITIDVDLEAQTVTLPGGRTISFPIDDFARQCMLNGVDELGYILQQDAEIASFEAGHPSRLNTLAAL